MPGKGQDIDTMGVLSRHGLNPNIAYETIETVATLGMIRDDDHNQQPCSKKYGFNPGSCPY